MVTVQGRKNVLLLTTLYAAAFVAGFNENLVNMALMSIMGEYGVDSVTAQWLVTGYMIVSTVVVSCMAFLYQRVRLRTLFLVAAVLSLVGSALGLVAGSFAMLMAARLIQAVGTGIFIPAMMNTILAVTPKNRLGAFMSIGGCVITFGPAFAPVVCGALVTAFGWHSIFVIPTVAMVVLIGCCFAFVRNLENTPAKLDVPSVALSALGLTAFVYGVSEVTANVTLAVGVLAIAVAAIAAFAWRQFHCDHPLIELSPLKNARFVMPLLLVMMAMMTTFSMSVLLPLYFEGALGMTALVAGVVMLAPVLTNAFATLFGGRVMDKRGEWPLLPAGFVCIVAGLALMVALSATMSLPGVFVGAVLVYVGVGLVLSPSQTAGLKNLPPRQNPSGVTLMTTCLQIAACIGPSLFVGVMNSAQAGALAGGAEVAASTALGFSSALLVAAVIAAIGLVVAFLFARPGAQEKAARTMGDTTRAMGNAPREVGDAMHAMGDAAGTVGSAACAMSDAAGDAVGATGPAVGATSPAPSAVVSGAATQGAPMGASAAREEEQPAGVHASSVTLAAVMETDPYTLPATARVEEAIRLLMDRKVSGMPVVDEAGRAVGFISDGDIMRYLADRHPLVTSAYSAIMLANEGSFDERLRELIALPVSAIATEGVVGVPVDASLEEACNLLAQHKLKKVPVLEAGRVVGTVNRSDVLRYAMGSLVGAPA
mgnify:CR=1 FL=1